MLGISNDIVAYLYPDVLVLRARVKAAFSLETQLELLRCETFGEDLLYHSTQPGGLYTRMRKVSYLC